MPTGWRGAATIWCSWPGTPSASPRWPNGSGRDHGVAVATLPAEPGLSLLVNSAGVGPRAAALASDPADLARLVELNIGAAHALTVAAAEAFAARGHGAIMTSPRWWR